MTRPPTDHHDAETFADPDEEQNGFHDVSKRQRVKRSDPALAGSIPPIHRQNLALWFWGAIGLLVVMTFVLSLMSIIHLNSDSIGEDQDISDSSQTNYSEISSSELAGSLNAANQIAEDEVRHRIAAMLEGAYQPAYDAIPAYADFHYSVLGEYAELSAAAIGKAGEKIEQTLFAGLEIRLRNIEVELDELYSLAFQTEIENLTNAKDGIESSLGPLTRTALSDASQRVKFSAPAGAVAIVGTKALSKVFAKKIASKLVVKAALKAGGKWTAIGSGAGAGAALCSWSGPGAGLCAAVGGIGVWLVADHGIVKLDEFWNRDDFEKELRDLIDVQKDHHRTQLENWVIMRSNRVREETQLVVETHDFSLRELYGEGNSRTCETARDLESQYDRMKSDIGNRSPEALQAFRATASQNLESFSLGRLANEITEKLKSAEQIKVNSIEISGGLPPEQRANRDVSGRLLLNGRELKVPRTGATEDARLMIGLEPNVFLDLSSTFDFIIFLEQHLRIKRNRYFIGNATMNIFPSIIKKGGLEHTIRIQLPITYDSNATSIASVRATPTEASFVSLSVSISSDPLPPLTKQPNCQ